MIFRYKINKRIKEKKKRAEKIVNTFLARNFMKKLKVYLYIFNNNVVK